MAFHDVTFPAAIARGASAGLERRTEIVTLANGFEQRNTPWAQARRRYDAGLGIRSLDDLATVAAFFEARRGRLHAFRWTDWLDARSCAPSGVPAADDQRIGTGDGTTRAFPLVKTYGSGADGVARPIRLPQPGSIVAAVDGAPAPFALADGVLTFDAAPAQGAAVTAGFRFDVPVRFDTDVLEVNVAAFEAGAVPSIPLVEVRL